MGILAIIGVIVCLGQVLAFRIVVLDAIFAPILILVHLSGVAVWTLVGLHKPQRSVATIGGSATGALGTTTSLQTASVLDAFTVLVGILVIAIYQSINGKVLAASAWLLARMLDGILASISNNFAALLIGAARNGAQASLNTGIKNFFWTIVRGIYTAGSALSNTMNFGSHGTSSITGHL